MKKPKSMHGEDCECSMCHGGKMKMAEGGEAKHEEPIAIGLEVHHPEESNPEDEIQDMLGKEMMDAIDSKDYKKIMQSIEATVLSCLNKKED